MLKIQQIDKLDKLFMQQVKLQKQLKNKPYANQQYINIMILAAIDELMEALRETPWKPWKKQQRFNEQAFQEEIIDLWHFIINLSLAAGLNADTIYFKFLNKNKINFERQEVGY